MALTCRIIALSFVFLVTCVHSMILRLHSSPPYLNSPHRSPYQRTHTIDRNLHRIRARRNTRRYSANNHDELWASGNKEYFIPKDIDDEAMMVELRKRKEDVEFGYLIRSIAYNVLAFGISLSEESEKSEKSFDIMDTLEEEGIDDDLSTEMIKRFLQLVLENPGRDWNLDKEAEHDYFEKAIILAMASDREALEMLKQLDVQFNLSAHLHVIIISFLQNLPAYFENKNHNDITRSIANMLGGLRILNYLKSNLTVHIVKEIMRLLIINERRGNIGAAVHFLYGSSLYPPYQLALYRSIRSEECKEKIRENDQEVSELIIDEFISAIFELENQERDGELEVLGKWMDIHGLSWQYSKSNEHLQIFFVDKRNNLQYEVTGRNITIPNFIILHSKEQ